MRLKASRCSSNSSSSRSSTWRPPSATTVATEIFVYRTESLDAALGDLRRRLAQHAEGEDSGLGDFGEHLLPRLIKDGKVRAFLIGGYWKDVGRPEAYLAAHRDFIAGQIDALHDRTPPVQRVPGTGVFLNRTKLTTPLAMRAARSGVLA